MGWIELNWIGWDGLYPCRKGLTQARAPLQQNLHAVLVLVLCIAQLGLGEG